MSAAGDPRLGAGGAASAEPAFQLKDVSIVFGTAPGAPGLRGIDLEARPGEFVVLVGRSGSGKTTILNLLSGLLTAQSGTVRILGKPPVQARPELGFMFARDALMPWRTARRNVELSLEILGRPRAECRQAAVRMLERVGLGHAVDRLPFQLSQGMRQRVALARTWVRSPRMLLMDEPFSALDAQTRREAQSAFLEVWAGSGASVVLVTHDLTEALMLADRVVLLANGAVVRNVEVPFKRHGDLDGIALTPEFRTLERELWELLK